MRILKFVIIQVVLVIALALVLEGVGRVYYLLKHGYSFKESLLYVEDKELVYKLNPNYKGEEVIHNGFRGEPFSKAKPKGHFRIVAMGGSTTWGSRTSSYRNSWPFQLQLLLNQNSQGNMKYEVINAAVSGYGSAQNYVRLKNEILNLKPDIIIILSGWNFVGALDNDVCYWVPDNVAKPDSGFVERIAAFLTNNSVIFAKLRARFPTYLDVFDLSIKEKEKLEMAFEKLAQKHKLYLQKIIKLCHENNIIPVLVKYPQAFNDSFKEKELDLLKEKFPVLFEYREYLNRQYKMVIDKIEEISYEDNVFLIDCAAYFNNFPFEKKIGLFVDQMHLTDEGLAIEALTIYNKLIKNKDFNQIRRKYILGSKTEK